MKSIYNQRESNLQYLISSNCPSELTHTQILQQFLIPKFPKVISSPEPPGSQGELIVYPCSAFGIRVPSLSVHIFKRLLWTCLTNQSQILCGASLGRGNESLYNDPGHMTKMAAMLKNAQNLKKIFFSRTTGPIDLKLGHVASGSVVLQSLYKSWPLVELDLF